MAQLYDNLCAPSLSGSSLGLVWPQHVCCGGVYGTYQMLSIGYTPYSRFSFEGRSEQQWLPQLYFRYGHTIILCEENNNYLLFSLSKIVQITPNVLYTFKTMAT